MSHIVDHKTNETLILLQAALASATAASQIVMPDGFELKNIECLNPLRDSYRSGFSTSDYSDFIEYSKKQALANAICTIDAERMSAKVVFDRGDSKHPLHGKNTASVTMQKIHAFKFLEALNGEKLSQKKAAEIFEDKIDYFSFKDEAGNEITCSSICQRVLKMKIKAEQTRDSEVSNFSRNQSSYDSIEINSSEAPLPPVVLFTCAPYLGLSDREFELRVTPSVSGSSVAITLTIINYEKHLEDIGQEFKEMIVGSFQNDEIETYVGSFSM